MDWAPWWMGFNPIGACGQGGGVWLGVVAPVTVIHPNLRHTSNMLDFHRQSIIKKMIISEVAMKIFISWSGTRSQALAEALREWLQLVLYYAQPWFSTSDIKSGDRWGIEIAKELHETNFGILCVTRDNLDAPWLLFEAGALAKSIDDGRVIPLLLDLEKSELSGPLTQFQAEKCDVEGVRRLIDSLNKASPTPVLENNLKNLFDSLWARFEASLSQIPTNNTPQKKTRTQSEILEEVVTSVRRLELRARDQSDESVEMRYTRRSRLYPDLILEISRRGSEDPKDPIQILIFASFLRDEFPWLYEMALETYHAIRKGDLKNGRNSYRRFRNSIENLRSVPYSEAIGITSKSSFRLLEAIYSLPAFEYFENSMKTLD